jgi:hypothetical protein
MVSILEMVLDCNVRMICSFYELFATMKAIIFRPAAFVVIIVVVVVVVAVAITITTISGFR